MIMLEGHKITFQYSKFLVKEIDAPFSLKDQGLVCCICIYTIYSNILFLTEKKNKSQPHYESLTDFTGSMYNAELMHDTKLQGLRGSQLKRENREQ